MSPNIYFKIFVDWGYGANDANYIDSRLRVDSVARVTANLLNFLIANNYTTYDDIYITGHSLGEIHGNLIEKKTEN